MVEPGPARLLDQGQDHIGAAGCAPAHRVVEAGRRRTARPPARRPAPPRAGRRSGRGTRSARRRRCLPRSCCRNRRGGIRRHVAVGAVPVPLVPQEQGELLIAADRQGRAARRGRDWRSRSGGMPGRAQRATVMRTGSRHGSRGRPGGRRCRGCAGTRPATWVVFSALASPLFSRGEQLALDTTGGVG